MKFQSGTSVIFLFGDSLNICSIFDSTANLKGYTKKFSPHKILHLPDLPTLFWGNKNGINQRMHCIYLYETDYCNRIELLINIRKT